MNPTMPLELGRRIPSRVQMSDAAVLAEAFGRTVKTFVRCGIREGATGADDDKLAGYARLAARYAEIVMGDAFTSTGVHVGGTR